MVSATVFSIERVAQLVEVGDLHVGAQAHAARSGASLPRISLSSVVLPAPLGPMRPMRSPRMTMRSRSLDELAAAEGFADVGELGDQLARALALADREPHVADARRAARRAPRAGARGAARGLRCACAAPRRPCGSTLPPAPRTCRTCACATASAASCSRLARLVGGEVAREGAAAGRDRARRCAWRRGRGRRGRG